MWRKFISHCLFLLIGVTPMFSQLRWDSLPGKFQWSNAANVMYADSTYIYAAGQFNEVGGIHMQGIARWNGVKWDSMGAGIDGKYYATQSQYPSNTLAMKSYHNKLYVGGEFSSLGKINAYAIGTWDGTKWDSIPIQPFEYNTKYNFPTGAVEALSVINNKLYMGGGFDTVAGIPCIGIACWNGNNWSSLNFPGGFSFHGINSICEYGGSIYAAGHFAGNNGAIGEIIRLDSAGNWHSVDTGIKGASAWINSMVVYKGELYVAGYFSKSGGNADNNIQRWDGTEWKAVGGGTDDEIFNLTIYNNKLYAMGELGEAGGIPASFIATWDGTEWCSIGSTFDNSIGTSCIYKDSLYIGGGFWTIDGDSISYIAEWTGGDYTANCGTETGVSEGKVESEEVKVYPNPTNQSATVQLNVQQAGDVEISVINLFGETVFTKNFPNQQGLFEQQIALSALPNGAYIIKAITKDNVYYTKIAKLQ